MQSLPTLATASGELDLPLSGRTAEQIVAALVTHQSDDCHDQLRRLLAPPLEADAALALWTACRAAERKQSDLRTADDLAGWLASTLRDEMTWPVPLGGNEAPKSAGSATRAASEQGLEPWADLAGRSYGIARLAAIVARYESLDQDQAHLLGLLHAAPEWMAAAGSSNRASRATPHSNPLPQGERGFDRTPLAPKEMGPERAALPLAELLPAWLGIGLAEIEVADGKEILSVADCVAAALRIAGGKRGSRSRWPDFKFNRRQHAARVASAGQAWLQRSTLGGVLPALTRKLARLQTLEQEFQRTLETEKLDSLKELAYGAGHEINNPLANISARAQTLLQEERDPERRRLLAAINTQAFRAHEMIADMMLFARPPQPQLAQVDVVEVLRTVVDELAPQATAQHCELVFHPPQATVVAWADKTQIAVAVRALCVNALEALVKGGRVELAVRDSHGDVPQAANSRATVQITVSDNGPGILPEARRHIFDPFYSGREAGRGLGFGLSKCWRIVSMHGGRIEVDSTPGGTTFTIILPARNAR